MKSSNKIFLLLLALLCVAVMLWLVKSKRPDQQTTEVARELATEQTEKIKAQGAPAKIATSDSSGAVATSTKDAATSDKKLSDYLAIHHHTIEFYGKVVDQDDHPLPNVPVEFTIDQSVSFAANYRKGTTSTDAQGLFTINGQTGAGVSVKPAIPGYVLIATNTWASVSAFTPEEQRYKSDAKNPVLIRMWKLQGAEPLVHFQIKTMIPIDGSSILFDLQKGHRVELGGDVELRVTSSLGPDPIQKYDWTATIRPVAGGILSNSGGLELQFKAPTEGYEPEYVIKNTKGDASWSSTFHGGFYLKSRGGSCYSKIGVGITANVVRDKSIPIVIEGYINANGSRNLEVDSKFVSEAQP